MVEGGTGGSVWRPAMVDDSGGSQRPGAYLPVAGAGVSDCRIHDDRMACRGVVSSGKGGRPVLDHMRDLPRNGLGPEVDRWQVRDFCWRSKAGRKAAP